jgi:nucleotide-binding universal stress UspA family protein
MTVRPQRILWPTDFTELALHGGKYARGFCEVFGAELHIIHVVAAPVPLEMSLTMPAEVPVALPEPGLLDAARESLRHLADEHFAGLPNIHREVFFGNPWSGVCDYAAQHDIDLVIVSTHGRTGLERVLTGSTAERIVQHAPCPVLTVKSPAKDFLTE